MRLSPVLHLRARLRLSSLPSPRGRFRFVAGIISPLMIVESSCVNIDDDTSHATRRTPSHSRAAAAACGEIHLHDEFVHSAMIMRFRERESSRLVSAAASNSATLYLAMKAAPEINWFRAFRWHIINMLILRFHRCHQTPITRFTRHITTWQK